MASDVKKACIQTGVIVFSATGQQTLLETVFGKHFIVTAINFLVTSDSNPEDVLACTIGNDTGGGYDNVMTSADIRGAGTAAGRVAPLTLVSPFIRLNITQSTGAALSLNITNASSTLQGIFFIEGYWILSSVTGPSTP